MVPSPLNVVGETRLTFTREGHEFTFEGLIVTNLDVDALAGTPFMEENNISVRPAKRQVIIGDGPIYSHGSQHPTAVSSAARRAIVLRSPPTSSTIWPGEFMEVELPADSPPDSEYALEPRMEEPSIKKLTASQLRPAPVISPLSPEPQFLK